MHFLRRCDLFGGRALIRLRVSQIPRNFGPIHTEKPHEYGRWENLFMQSLYAFSGRLLSIQLYDDSSLMIKFCSVQFYMILLFFFFRRCCCFGFCSCCVCVCVCASRLFSSKQNSIKISANWSIIFNCSFVCFNNIYECRRHHHCCWIALNRRCSSIIYISLHSMHIYIYSVSLQQAQPDSIVYCNHIMLLWPLHLNIELLTFMFSRSLVLFWMLPITGLQIAPYA